MARINISQIFGEWHSAEDSKKEECVFNAIKQSLSLEDIPEGPYADLQKYVDYFCIKFKTKWKECGRKKEIFKNRHKKWLLQEISLPGSILNVLPSEDQPQKEELKNLWLQNRPKNCRLRRNCHS